MPAKAPTLISTIRVVVLGCMHNFSTPVWNHAPVGAKAYAALGGGSTGYGNVGKVVAAVITALRKAALALFSGGGNSSTGYRIGDGRTSAGASNGSAGGRSGRLMIGSGGSI